MMRPRSGSPALAVAVLVAAFHLLPDQARARPVTDEDPTGSRLRTDEFTGWWHNAGQLLLHVSNRGFFGRHGADSAAPSAEWPAGSNHEYLYAAGLWVGGSSGPTRS